MRRVVLSGLAMSLLIAFPPASSAEPVTPATVAPLGPAATELQMFHKRIDSPRDVSEQPLAVLNLASLGALYKLSGQPAETARLARVGMLLTQGSTAEAAAHRAFESALAAAN